MLVARYVFFSHLVSTRQLVLATVGREQGRIQDVIKGVRWGVGGVELSLVSVSSYGVKGLVTPEPFAKRDY